jgi:N-acetylmuramoyl-L-alanine amidase
MMKAATYLQTLQIITLPLFLIGFNFSLSFQSPSVKETKPVEAKPSISCHAHHHELEYSNLIPFGKTMGKVIKDRRIAKKDYQIKTVVIDPGHGGHDPGCLGGNSREKHLALAISLKLAKEMQAAFPQIKVILTRDADVFIPLHERAAIANRNKADLFISIHCNYMPGSSATQGSETYVMGLHTAEHNLKVAKRENAAILLEVDYERNYDYDPNSPEGHILLSMFQNAYLEQSILFAERVEQNFAISNRKSRGVKQAGFVVLKETAMPSVLVETGFLSSAAEEAFLMQDDGQQTIANAILTAFEEYKSVVEEGKLPLFSSTQANPPSTLTDQPAASLNTQTPSPAPLNDTYQPKSIPSSSTSPEEYHILVAEEPVRKSANIQLNVQLAASPRPLDTTEDRWKSTGYLIEVIKENNLYKYQARNFSSMQSAFEARLLLQSKGFPDAFIVAYKDGERITLDQARKALGVP